MSGHLLPGDMLDLDTICGPKFPRPELCSPGEKHQLLLCRTEAGRESRGGWEPATR